MNLHFKFSTFFVTDETTTEQNWAHLQTNNPFRSSNPQLTLTNSGQKEEGKQGERVEGRGAEAQRGEDNAPSSPPSGSPNKRRAGNKEMYSLLQELDQER